MPARYTEESTLGDSTADGNGKSYNGFPVWNWPVKDEVVISGVSGRFPESENVAELRDHLLFGDDLITSDDRRWPVGLHGTPAGFGKLKELRKFDATFFGLPAKLVDCSDPQLRLLLEVSYEAIVDAGVNPQNLRGSRTGVFTGCCSSEAEEALSSNVQEISGYSLLGCSRSMFANRLSYFLDFKGPSCSVDTACSSSLIALDKALSSIRSGDIDQALVCGCNVLMKPCITFQFSSLGMMSPTSCCHSFDADADGYVRAETVAVVFLQRARDAKRVYATVVHAKTNNDGFKNEGPTFPSGVQQGNLIKEIYREAGINPADVAYIECHGTGTKAGDPQETNAIADIFCNKRQGPLLIGSVKSVLGHGEGSAGMAQLAKMIIAMEEGVLPANLHFKTPNPDIKGLMDGRLKVVTECTKWNGGLVGINSFGFGGSNAHVLLRSNPKPKSVPIPEGQKLVAVSGRTEEAVNTLVNYIQRNHDPDFLSLLGDMMDSPPALHHYRAYAILNSDTPNQEIQKCIPEERPLWYVFSGVGSQWVGMGRDMMQMEVFRKSIEKSHDVLKPYDIDILELIKNGTLESLEKILNSFTLIASIQVALVDCLRTVGLTPDGMLGHSVGELGCAYADGCLTAEQMVLAAYWRGYCIQNGDLEAGGMAAIGMTWEEAKKRCPTGVVPACHNAEDSVTVSGPVKLVEAFVKELQEEKIFAKKVQSSGQAFHSYIVNKAAPALQSVLDKVIPSAKPRSSKWISTSIPEHQWHLPLAKTSSASYHVNNLTSPVLFHEALQHVPKNAIVIEIAPHSLLQAILRRSLSVDVINIGLAHREKKDNYNYFLSCLGKLYLNGYNFKVSNLYRPVSFPVPRGTPMISPLIKWDHSQDWFVPKYTDFAADRPTGFSDVSYTIDVSKPTSKDYFLVDHAIDGRVIFPATGYLVLVWKAFAKAEKCAREKLAVQFEDVSLHRASILPKEGSVTFHVTIMRGGGEFEIIEGGSLVVSGSVFVAAGRAHDNLASAVCKPDTTGKTRMSKSDIYKDLRLRGYEYGPQFQGILDADIEGVEGQLVWDGNWISFMDTMLQFTILNKPFRHLCLPTRIPFLRITPSNHPTSDGTVPVVYDNDLNVCLAGGVQIMGLKASATSKRQNDRTPLLEEYAFVPYDEDNVFAKAPTFENRLLEYNKVCLKTIQAGLKQFLQQKKEYLTNAALFQTIAKIVPSVTVQEQQFLFKNNFSTQLYQFLKDTFAVSVDAQFSETTKQLLNQFWKTVASEDTLVSSLHQGHALKSCVDIVIENFLAKTLHVVEIESSKSSISKAILNIFSNQTNTRADFVLTDETTDDLIETAEEMSANTATWTVHSSTFSGSEAHLVVGNYALFRNQDHLETSVNNVAKSLKTGGFALFNEFHSGSVIAKFISALSGHKTCPTHEAITKAFEKADLKVVSFKSDDVLNKMYLVRKVGPVRKSVRIHVDTEDCEAWVDKLIRTCEKMQEGSEDVNLYLMAEKQPISGIVGLVNCLRAEGLDKIRCIFNASTKHQKTPAYGDIYAKDLVMNVYRDGQWGSYRLLSTGNEEHLIKTDHAYVNVMQRGDLSSLRWLVSPLKFTDMQAAKNRLCHVYYAPLNFRDVMLATGKLPPEALPGNASMDDCILGLEFSGRNAAGKRVMGLVSSKGLATTVLSDPVFVWEIPENWSLEEAATVPVVYTTAYYALVIRGQLQPGESVLIHSGSGGVGQAAISIALHMGCTVYTTVGSAEKRNYLKEKFPQLTDNNFANSRDVSFEYDIKRATGGKGVDVILNSLSEDKLQASVRCLATHGRFLEIGKYDLSKNSPLGMSCFLLNTTFHGILLDALFDTNNKINSVLKNLIIDGIKSGAVKPLKRTVFESDQLEDAFRFMASGKHIGKVLIKVRDEKLNKAALASLTNITVLPQLICHPEKTYILTGGLGGFGLELAHWLVARGARYLVLSSRSGIRNGYQARCLKQWRDKGINVIVSTENISTAEGAGKLVKEHGSVGGIFHLAAVLKDAMIENQSVESYKAVFGPKIDGAHHLDTASRKFCPNLDWFVVFSSVVAGRGNGGQTNYGFANSVMERICEKRKDDGLHGLAIQWGAIGDVGLVHDNMGGNDTVVGGSLPQRLTSCFTTMERFLLQDYTVVSSVVLADKRKSEKGGNQRDIVANVAHILGVKDGSSLNADVTLAEMGLDSLMGVELKQMLERDYETTLTMQEIRLLTVAKLKTIGGGGEASEKSGKGTTTTTETKAATDYVPEKPLRYDLKEMTPKKCLVPLNDKKKGTPLFIVHPIEGHVKMLKSVAEKISCPVYGLQCTARTPTDSISKLAHNYMQEIQQLQSNGPYQISGYSFGAAVAFELSLQFQKHHPNNPNIVKHLIMLDGSHQYVAAHTIGYTSSDAGAQADGLLTFAQMFITFDFKKERQSLVTLSSWQERLNQVTDLLMKSNMFKDRIEVALTAELFYNRVVASHQYQCDAKVNAPVTLVRAAMNVGAVDALGKDYSLEKVCTKEVTIHVVDGNHEDFILEPKATTTAQVINTIVNANTVI